MGRAVLVSVGARPSDRVIRVTAGLDPAGDRARIAAPEKYSRGRICNQARGAAGEGQALPLDRDTRFVGRLGGSEERRSAGGCGEALGQFRRSSPCRRSAIGGAPTGNEVLPMRQRARPARA